MFWDTAEKPCLPRGTKDTSSHEDKNYPGPGMLGFSHTEQLVDVVSWESRYLGCTRKDVKMHSRGDPQTSRSIST